MHENMNLASLFQEGIAGLKQALSWRELSLEELCTELLDRINRLDPVVNSFISLNPRLLEDARRLERRGAGGELKGVPVTVKDLLLTRDLPTTAGSAVPHPFRESFEEGPAVARLRRAGALIVGKTNLHEFAFGVTSENDHYGPVRNPWSLNHVSGGSSGGAAVSIAAGFSLGAVGTDTRGSIRIPSACCGVTGLKPTRGRISTQGVIPLSWSLDHVGPIAGSVEDSELLFRVMAGKRRSADREESLGGPRLGLVVEFLERLDSDVREAVLTSAETFRRAGCTVREVNLKGLGPVLDASDVISKAEAFTYHRPWLEQYGSLYGARVRDRMSMGVQLTAVDLVSAQRIQAAFMEEVGRSLTSVDCLIGPTLPVAAPRIGDTEVDCGGRREAVVPCLVRMTAPFNMAGLPALSIPCGFSSAGLPVGLQLAARAGDEDSLFRAGRIFQRETDWHRRRPEIGIRL